MPDQLKCDKCKTRYPKRFIQSMCINGLYHRVCPQCANNIRNEVHGLPMGTPFQGKEARQLHKVFTKWKQRQKRFKMVK